jgi:uncharacterized protein (DUF697 family)
MESTAHIYCSSNYLCRGNGTVKDLVGTSPLKVSYRRVLSKFILNVVIGVAHRTAATVEEKKTLNKGKKVVKYVK